MERKSHIEPALRYVDQWLGYQHAVRDGVPGLAAAIVQDGEVLFERTYGKADLARGEDLTPEHLFRIASHSKTVTAVAVFQLVDAGSIRLDDPVRTYLPWLERNPDPRVQRITVRQLLSHTTGSQRDGPDPVFWQLQRPFPGQDELVRFFETEPLVLEHNTRFKYSNMGFGLLGLVIEAVSGKGFAAYVRERVLGPLGLTAIGPEYAPDAGRYVTGHAKPTPAVEPIGLDPTLDTGALAPATGFYATPRALCAFYAALLDDQRSLVSVEARREMLRMAWDVPDDDMRRSYGLGFIQRRIGRRHLIGHSGSFPGQLSATLFDPGERLVATLLVNSYLVAPDLLQRGLWHILDTFEARHDPEAGLERHAGRFYRLSGPADFVPLGKRIAVVHPGFIEPFASAAEIEPVDGGGFRVGKDVGFGNYGDPVTFTFADDGSLDRVTIAGMPWLREAALSDLVAGLPPVA